MKMMAKVIEVDDTALGKKKSGQRLKMKTQSSTLVNNKVQEKGKKEMPAKKKKEKKRKRKKK